jgi:SAM-dependent methyltransferase
MSHSAIHTLVAFLIAEGVTLIALILIPRLLRLFLGAKKSETAAWQKKVELRYQNQSVYVWLFARSKLRLDPMFRELPEFLRETPLAGSAIDLGCGHGVAGCSLLEWFPNLKIYGIDPGFDRVRAASRAFADRGRAFCAAAPNFESPEFPDRISAAFALDMIHYLDDPALELTLKRIRARSEDGGHLVIRVPMRPQGIGSIVWHLDKLTRWLNGASACFRSVDQIQHAIANAGFQIIRTQMSGRNQDLFWFIAVASLSKAVIERDGTEQKHDHNVDHNQRSQMPVAEFIPPL